MASGENPRPGGQFKSWQICIVEDLREFRATKVSTEHFPLMFGAETALWSTAETNVASGAGGSLKQPNGSW